MTNIDPNSIEKYQLLYEKDPQSKVFAPLVEAYRKMGLQKEALEVGEKGVAFHPFFVAGRIALGRVLMDLKKWEEASQNLKVAADNAPENILAHSLLGDCYLKLKKTKEALKTFKMVLFLNPNHKRAQQIVQKLESLTADEYDDEVFEMTPLKNFSSSPNEPSPPPSSNKEETEPSSQTKQRERSISLADAYIARNDLDKAQETLNEALKKWGPHPEINKRLQLFSTQNKTSSPTQASRKQLIFDEKIHYLKKMLKQVENRRHPT